MSTRSNNSMLQKSSIANKTEFSEEKNYSKNINPDIVFLKTMFIALELVGVIPSQRLKILTTHETTAA